MIQYLTSIACRVEGLNGDGASLETRISQANSILEAFVHAKTTKNNNSSRFVSILVEIIKNKVYMVAVSVYKQGVFTLDHGILLTHDFGG